LFFWDVTEHCPHLALEKLQPFLTDPNEMRRKIARELAEDIEADIAHARAKYLQNQREQSGD
jgi:hypothetical protein